MTPISGISPPPRDMMAPLPNCFSMAATAAETAFSFSFNVDMTRSPCAWVWFELRSIDGLVETAVLQGLGHVRGTHPGAGVQVGDGAGQAAYPIDGPGRQGQPLHRALEQPVSVGIEGGHLAQLGAGEAGVGTRTPRALALAGRLDAIANGGAALAGPPQGQ